MNIVAPDDEAKGNAATVQVVDENQVFQNGLLGFTLYLAFCHESSEQGELERFERYSRRAEFESVPTEDGVPCFACRFGKDTDALLDILSDVLQFVYGYPLLTAFKCDVDVYNVE